MRRLRRNPVAVLCGIYILVVVGVAIFAGSLAPYPYDAIDQSYSSLPAPPDHRHLLGTDNLGQDVLSRLIFGARISLLVAVVTVAVIAVLGVTVGVVAGFYGGIVDSLLMRITDVMFAFPDLLLAILVRAVLMSGDQALPPTISLLSLFVALGVVYWPTMARLVRGQVLSLREKEFVEAARATGVKNAGIIWRHLLPNLAGPIIVQVTLDLAGVILGESTLSFLGIGVQPPVPSWGRMIHEARDFMRSQPVLILTPSLALAVTVMAFNFFGDALRDALDPRLRS
jgi:ABC-type dipeptide/oligopeptide/nickel transport system permease subunit